MPIYTIHAWCVRPFIACIDVEATTPEEAVAKAMNNRDDLLGSAEECNPYYLWDEYAVSDESGKQVLHVMTDEGKLRDAAADLISALQWLVDDLTDAEEDRNPETGDEYDSVANVRSVLAKAWIIHGFGAGAVGVSSCFQQAGAVCIKRLRQ